MSSLHLLSPNTTCWFLADLSAEYLRNSMYRFQSPCPLHCSLTNHNPVAARQKLGMLYHPERCEPLCRSWHIPTTRNTVANCFLYYEQECDQWWKLTICSHFCHFSMNKCRTLKKPKLPLLSILLLLLRVPCSWGNSTFCNRDNMQKNWMQNYAEEPE